VPAWAAAAQPCRWPCAAALAQVQDQGPGQRLQQACEMVARALAQAGLPGDGRPLKLHATLINTRSVRSRGAEAAAAGAA
jgi:hypothetical protein